MAVTAVAKTGSNTEASITASTQQLDKEAFLKLLITELRNQDPMNPMEDKDFIAQLAQFSSLEQMQSLNSTIHSMGKSEAATRALAMIGKQIDYANAEGGSLSGKVTGVSFVDGSPVLDVGSAQVELSNVLSVYL